jgi:hypothetical protein
MIFLHFFRRYDFLFNNFHLDSRFRALRGRSGDAGEQLFLGLDGFVSLPLTELL